MSSTWGFGQGGLCQNGDFRTPSCLRQTVLDIFPRQNELPLALCFCSGPALSGPRFLHSLFPSVHVDEHVCLLDCIVVDLQDMDIFAAERRPREYSKAADDNSGALIFPSYLVRQTGGSLLTEPCRLKLQVERNLDK